MKFLICLVIVVNFITVILFIADKRFAMRKGKRISESTLHFFELLGGVFSVILIMPIIRHKNKKRKYWIVSILILIGWIFLLGFSFNHFYT